MGWAVSTGLSQRARAGLIEGVPIADKRKIPTIGFGCHRNGSKR